MLLFDWTVHKAITYNEQLKMKRDAQLEEAFYVTALEALELKKNGIFIMTLNRISLLTFPHSSAVCKNDTIKLFNQPPVVLSYRPRHCCGIRPRLWAVSIVSNKKNLKNSISSKLDQTVLTPRIFLPRFGVFRDVLVTFGQVYRKHPLGSANCWVNL